MEFETPRLDALLYIDTCQNYGIEQKSFISFFIKKLKKYKKMHIMSFLNNREFVIKSVINLPPINFSNNVSICVIYTNNNTIYYDRIVGIFANGRGIVFKTQISNGNQNLFESESGRIFELGNLCGIKYSSVLGNAQLIAKIIIYDNNAKTITLHKNSKSYENCNIIAIAI